MFVYFSFDKDENVRLEEEIKLHHLEQLMTRFHHHKPDDIILQAGTGFFPAKTLPRTPGRMNLDEFKQTVSDVLTTQEYDDYLEKLFMKVFVLFCKVCNLISLSYRNLKIVVKLIQEHFGPLFESHNVLPIHSFLAGFLEETFWLKDWWAGSWAASFSSFSFFNWFTSHSHKLLLRSRPFHKHAVLWPGPSDVLDNKHCSLTTLSFFNLC